MKNFIKHTWPTMCTMLGLCLTIDNWGHNHELLILPGLVLFTIGLQALIRQEIEIREVSSE